MILVVGLVLLAVSALFFMAARKTSGIADFRYMWGGYFGFLGAFCTIGSQFGYNAWSYHFVFEIILGLVSLAFSFLLVQHVKYNRSEAANAERAGS
ncbi:MAG: hypothetical protein AB7G39_14520 [Alphaproteobacteria bacterium]